MSIKDEVNIEIGRFLEKQVIRQVAVQGHKPKSLFLWKTQSFSFKAFNWLEEAYLHFAEKAMASHSGTLIWKIPWMEEPGGLQFDG